jgi:hypothetical protein
MWSSVPASTVASSPAPGAEENDGKEDEEEAIDTGADKMDADVDMLPPRAEVPASLLFVFFEAFPDPKWRCM